MSKFAFALETAYISFCNIEYIGCDRIMLVQSTRGILLATYPVGRINTITFMEYEGTTYIIQQT